MKTKDTTKGLLALGFEKFQMLGVKIANVTMNEGLDLIDQAIECGAKKSFAFVNADCLNRATLNHAYARVLSRQEAVFADGSGINLAARMRGIRVKDNVNGTDMFPLLCERAAEKHHGIFLLGARPGVAEAVAAHMQVQYPGLIVSGTHDGYFTGEQTDAVIDTINRSGAAILLVAMGAPHQEIWINKHLSKLNVNVAIGVGGLFDFFGGRIPRAPVWLRQAGCEWTYRLWQEPGRMWQRYLIGNPLFVLRTWREHARNLTKVDFPWAEGRSRIYESARQLKRRHGSQLQAAAKRSCDVLFAALGIAVLSPIFVLLALAIKWESAGPVFFTQKRVGLNGKRFRMWKFRSMYIDAEARRASLVSQSDRSGAHFKMKSDPRITRIGKFIRRASIDELPQLYNVLVGDMSLVGPRPNLEVEVERYKFDEFERLHTKPGITCIWQVSGRAEVPWARQVQMDLDYVYERSFVQDFVLLAKTLPAILFGKGAY
jgi:exopolysaccharide biosynthesis WecB/TagA/CpsF family protein